MVGRSVGVGRVSYIDKLLGIVFGSGFVIIKASSSSLKALFVIAEGDDGYQCCNSEYETGKIDLRGRVHYM